MAITEVKNSNYTETKSEELIKEQKESKSAKKETKNNTYKNSKEYSDYLNDKYSCLKPANESSTTIAPSLLAKAATDEKTAQWLEYNLGLMPDSMDKMYEEVARQGGRVVSCSVTFDGYDSITTQLHTVSEADPGTEEAKKLVEEAREKNKERREQQEKLQEKRKEKQQIEEKRAERHKEQGENSNSLNIIGNNLDSITNQITEKLSFTKRGNGYTSSIDVKA